MRQIEVLQLSQQILDLANKKMLSVFSKSSTPTASVMVFGIELRNIDKEQFDISYHVVALSSHKWFRLTTSWDFVLGNYSMLAHVELEDLPRANVILEEIFKNAKGLWSQEAQDEEDRLFRLLPTPPFRIKNYTKPAIQ